MKPEDMKLLREIVVTPLDQLINDHKVYCEFQGWQWEETLNNMIADYKKWANKSINKEIRKLELEIIKELGKELESVRHQDNTHNRRTLGFCIGRDKQENRNARDTNNLASQIIPQPFRVEKKRIYRISGQTIERKISP